MLTHEEIVSAVKKATTEFPLTRVSYFGSYADGCATENSDLDLLVEFEQESVSILTIIGLKHHMEDELGISVDVIHAPLPPNALIRIEKEVRVYE
jgi:predicted nucleotidyltransferase